MFNSVRSRLTVWYVGVLSLVLVGFSVGVYTVLARDARANADHDLAEAIDVLSRSLRHEVDEHEGKEKGEESFRDVVDTVYRDSFPGIAIAAYEGPRRVTARPGPGGIVPGPAADAGSSLQFATLNRNHEPWRSATLRIVVKDAGPYEFISEASLASIEADLAGLRRILFLAVPLALAAAAFGGFLLARKSLAPVVAMSDTADRISSKDLSQRIASGNPKDELGKLASTLNRLLDRLEGSFSRQRQFMADSSHELRTPIYVARTAAQVTLERASRTEEDYREALVTIDQQLNRLTHLVEDMFVLARADAGDYPLELREFDLGEATLDCVRAAKLLGQRKKLTVTSQPLRELSCHGDEGLIRQLIMILLDNAVKYTPAGGAIAVEIGEDDPAVYSILVKDTGPGIPVEARAHIFDRFYRLDKARSRTASKDSGGAGLGLAIAKWIAELHGGSLQLVDSESAGSTFRATVLRSLTRKT